MSKIVPELKNGQFIELDTNNHLYEEKIRKGWQNMIGYAIKVNGIDFDFKTAVINKNGELFEAPYSLKKAKS